MSNLRILVVEDDLRWQQILHDTLQQIASTSPIEIARDAAAARHAFINQGYDLVTIDLSLGSEIPLDPLRGELPGMQLLRDLRGSRYNRLGCGLIVLTGYPTTARVRQALKEYHAEDFIDKTDFDDRAFMAVAKAAIRNARLRRTAVRARERYRLLLSFGPDRLISTELDGPDRRAIYAVPQPATFDTGELVQRADGLNALTLQGGAAAWRPEARAVGDAIYDALTGDRRVLGDLVSARALADRFSDLWIQFSGPAESLGLPFELLRDQDDYLGLAHILTRRLAQAGPTLSHKTEPFHTFVENLVRSGEMLRILVVGANSDGAIPKVEQEARELAAQIETELTCLGIDHQLVPLIGPEASYARVAQELRQGGYHMFHYAGHGLHSEEQPEVSGLVLHGEHGRVTLSASDLNLMMRDTDLQVVFLSCCLGARNASRTGRGDFHGTLEAIARADVPIVLGYRWTVVDEPARNLALQFYSSLWRTFAPGEALLEARRCAAQGPGGRDDETWAAPMLLLQNG